jgi:predicted metal-dependent peptidase
MLTARVQLLFDMPFIGTLTARLKLVDASSWCSTAATDGKHFFYNREFIKGLNQQELMFLCGHEVFHCVFDHLGRRGGRDPKILNMAQDYVINYALKEMGCGKMPEGGLYDEKFTDEMSSEEVYEILKKNSVKIKLPLDMHLDLLGQESDDEDGKGQGQDGEGGGDGQEVEVTVMGKDGPPKLTEKELNQMRQELKSAVIQAARNAEAAGAGGIPKAIQRMIDELIEPQLDWRSMLDAHIRSSVKGDYTFSRVSRKTSAIRYATDYSTFEDAEGDDPFASFRSIGAPMLPSQDFDLTIDISVYIDCSGSETPAMIRDQLSETKGIMQTFPDFVVRVATFDTQIYNYREYRPDNIHEIDEYPITGGGGTAFEAIYNHLKANEIEPRRLIVFTDGLPNGTWGDPNYCDTLFVIHSNTHIKAPFGMTAYYVPKDGVQFKQAA